MIGQSFLNAASENTRFSSIDLGAQPCYGRFFAVRVIKISCRFLREITLGAEAGAKASHTEGEEASQSVGQHPGINRHKPDQSVS